MAMIRVYELAREYGLESKDLLKAFQDSGEYVRSASETLSPLQVRRVLRQMGIGAHVPPPATGGGRRRTTVKPPSDSGAKARRGVKPPFSAPGARIPKPSEAPFVRRPEPSELTEADVLRNLMGADFPPPAPKRTLNRPKSSTARSARRQAPAPQVIPELLDPWEQALYRPEHHRTMGQLATEVDRWKGEGLSLSEAKSWRTRAPRDAASSDLLALRAAGFTPSTAFKEFDPNGNGRTVTPYQKVRAGTRAEVVAEMYSLAGQRRRGMAS